MVARPHQSASACVGLSRIAACLYGSERIAAVIRITEHLDVARHRDSGLVMRQAYCRIITMPSADSSRPAGEMPAGREASPGKNMLFPSAPAPFTSRTWFLLAFGRPLVSQRYPSCWPRTTFLSVRSDVCLVLPSDPASPQAPLPSAMCLAPKPALET